MSPSTLPSGATFAFSGSGASRTLMITPNAINTTIAASPILVTVTDTNGDSAATWFHADPDLALNLPPTNSLTSFTGGNTLANTSITIPLVKPWATTIRRSLA